MLIQYNFALTSLEGLNNLSNLKGGFSSRESKFIILDSPSLTNVDTFSNLEGRDKFSIEIRNNELLENINGLGSLTQLGSFDISNNNSLSNLEGVNSLETVKQIKNNQNFSGLNSNVTVTYALIVYSNDSITSLDFNFENEIYELFIENNNSLTTLNFNNW